MRRMFCAIVIATLALPGSDALAQHGKRAPGGQNLRTIQIECMKQQGAYYDAAEKKWIIPPAPPTIMSSRIDAVYNCVAQRTGRRAEPFMQERTIYH